MADMEDLLHQRSKTRAGETPASTRSTDSVPSDSIRRPWQGLDLDMEFEEPTAYARLPSEEWYASLEGILLKALARKKHLAITFFVSLLLTTLAASFVPSSYSSTLQLYAPEKTDSVASRLQLFSNKIEFASFPVDFKIPLGLIAKRVSSEAAKQSVMMAYAAMPEHATTAPIDGRLVSADTFYAEGSELLVIQGYANNPEIAKEITNLYWNYLEKEIKSLRDDNLEKVGRWLDLTSTDWNDRLATISSEISSMPAESYQNANDGLRIRLTSEESDAELKQRKVQKELTELRLAVSDSNPERIWTIPDADIQDLRRVNQAIGSRGISSRDDTSLASQARELAKGRISEKHVELAAANDQLRQLRVQLNESSVLNKKVSYLSAKQTDLLRQQSDYVGRVEDLEKLRNQIDVERTLVHTKLRPIQAAFADATTARPSLVLKYSVALMVALMAAVMMLIMLESKSRFRIRK